MIWIAILGVVTWRMLRLSYISPSLTRFLNVAFMAALVFPVGKISYTQLRALATRDEIQTALEMPIPLSLEGSIPLPDVYYIILDSYARDDVLEDTFGYDNTPFLSALEELGFVVAGQSRSNYAITRLSLPSSLNMNYIDELGIRLDPNAKDSARLDRISKSSIVRKAFESLGYQIVAFKTVYDWTDWVDSDLYLSPHPVSMADAQAFGGLNSFELLLIQTSLGRAAIDTRVKLKDLFGVKILDPNEQHRDLILFALDRLGRMPEIPGPKFVFVHIMSPHPPYIFTADGGVAMQGGVFTLADNYDEESDVDFYEGYRNQVVYLNSRVLEEIAKILANSDPLPIIVIQGDHGAFHVSNDDRMKILNAYYLPGGGQERLYDNISPVNTFRVILDLYFGGDLPLLEDSSYYSDNDHPFLLSPIP